MDAKAPRDLLDCLSTLEDPRMARTREHRLDDIRATAVPAVICGAAPGSITTLHEEVKLLPEEGIAHGFGGMGDDLHEQTENGPFPGVGSRRGGCG